MEGGQGAPWLEAAHILPVSTGGEHRIDNGVLLRSDMHTLFDRGYIGFDRRHALRVSPAISQQFGNGDWLYSREGTQIALPDRHAERPNPDYLECHMDEIFVSQRQTSRSSTRPPNTLSTHRTCAATS